MTVIAITLEELILDVEEALSAFGISLHEFAAMDLDDIYDWELRDIWLMFHSEVAEWCDSHGLVAA